MGTERGLKAGRAARFCGPVAGSVLLWRLQAIFITRAATRVFGDRRGPAVGRSGRSGMMPRGTVGGTE